MAPTARSKHSNPREDARIVKQNNPNNPSRADARETKGEKKNPASSSVTPETGLLFKQKQTLINNLEQFHQSLWVALCHIHSLIKERWWG